MIQADKNKLVEWGFTRFNRHFINFHFEHVYLWEPPLLPPTEKTLYLINHSSWWDPLIIFHLNDQVVGSNGFGMMSEEGINRHSFFRKIGAFSINPNNRRHLIDSLNYSTHLLAANNAVWMFPQGEEQHTEKQPLQFFTGAAYIANKLPDVNIVPITIYYSLEHTRRPNAYISIGNLIKQDGYHSKNRKMMTEMFEQTVTDQLQRLRQKIIEEDHSCFKDINVKKRNGSKK